MATSPSPCRPYRIFVSYSHNDRDTADRIVKHLEAIGAKVMYDADIVGGTRFSEEIRWRISCAHAFVCILTEESQRSSWVISELGYAMGVGVPVLPLSLDELPPGLAHEIHAIRLNSDLSDLASTLTPSMLAGIVEVGCTTAKASFECASLLRERTTMLVDETNRLHRYAKHHFHVRQRAAFTSFSIPDVSADDSVWADWHQHLSEEERELLRKERRVMQEHASEAGCDLIVDPYVMVHPSDSLSRTLWHRVSRKATITRLKTVYLFLETQKDDRCAVVIQKGRIDGNSIILGDWLAAQAVVPHYKHGSRQTIFTRHTPTISRCIEKFDQDFADGLVESHVARAQSRQNGMQVISRIIEDLCKSQQDGHRGPTGLPRDPQPATG